MNEVYFTHRIDFTHPTDQTPTWAPQVERWYQLDAPAYGLCELYVREKLHEFPQPEIIFLASPGGCNETDLQFVQNGAASPAKFVHTLPNIRGSVLLQVMNWHGPLLCYQCDPCTLETAMKQGALLDRRVWIFGSSERHAFCLRLKEKTRGEGEK